MKFISLFAGVGGFDEGMERAGHECVAQVEWDKNAAGVLKRRWPDVPLFCDVSKVTADDLPDCDFITYGFPCQDLSVAGKRKGLEGERSGLFFEACRIIKGLAERAVRRGGAGGGRFLALAENVPGIFSSGNGLDFAGCIRELLDIGASEVGWTVLDTQHVGWRSPCGRVVRAAPQRRRRVFISAAFGHFGEGTAGEIFSQQSRLRRYFEKGGKTGQNSPSDASGGFTPGSFGGYEPGVGTLRSQGGDLGGGSETLAVARMRAFGDYEVDETASAIKERDHKDSTDLVVQGCDVYNGEETGDTAATVTSATGIANASGPKVMASIQNCTRGKDQNGLGVTEGDSPVYTLGGADQHAVCHETPASGPKVMEAIPLDMRQCQRSPDKHDDQNRQSTGTGEPGDPSYTLTDGSKIPAVCHETPASGPKVMEAIAIQGSMIGRKEENGPQGSGYNDDGTSFTLTETDQHAVCSWSGDTTPKASEDVSVTLRSQQDGEGVGVAFQQNERCEVRYVGGDGDIAGALAGDPGMHNQNFVQSLTVRRLTCRECERLQGFPDDWTLEKMELELEGNEWKATGKVVKQADGPRYRACGNAVTVNVAEWIGRRLKRLQATYTPEELDELGVGTTCPQTLGEYLREDRG